MFCGLKSHVTLNWVVISRKAGSPGNLRGRLGPGESEHRSPEVNTELRFRPATDRLLRQNRGGLTQRFGVDAVKMAPTAEKKSLMFRLNAEINNNRSHKE